MSKNSEMDGKAMEYASLLAPGKSGLLSECQHCGRKYAICCICDKAEEDWNNMILEVRGVAGENNERVVVEGPYPGKGMNSYRVYVDGSVVFQDNYEEEDMYVDYTGHEREFDEYIIPDELVDHIADLCTPALQEKNDNTGFIEKLHTLLNMAAEMGLKIPEVVIVEPETFNEYRTGSDYADLLSRRIGPSGFGVPRYGEIGVFRGTVIKERVAAYTEV